MRINRLALIALISLGLAACAAPSQSSQLSAPAKQAEIELKFKLSYKRVSGPLNVAWEEGLVPGVYVAEKENELGIFFRGPGRCVWLHSSLQPEFTTVRPGGIWIPHSASAAPRLYFYTEGGTYRVSNVDEYIAGAQSEQGKAVFTDVGGPILSPLSNALVSASAENNKDIPNLNFEIVDKEFIQAIQGGYRTK